MNANASDDERPLDSGLPRKAPMPAASPPKPTIPAAEPDPKPKVTQPAVTAYEKLHWGLVGSRNMRGSLAGDYGEVGVIRIVEAGVTYKEPPKETGLREWIREANNPQRYGMPWRGDPRSVQSLEALGQDLGQNPPTSLTDRRLGELDEVMKSLLRIAIQLHERGIGLGLLNPRNILIVAGKNGKDILLPDFGFTWKNGPFKPTWLAAADFKALWDNAPEIQQHLGSAGDGGTPLDPAADVRTLARIFASVLTGSPSRDLGDTPPASSHHQNPAALLSVWKTLVDAVKGDIKSMKELEPRLLSAPLSQFVFALPPPARVDEKPIPPPRPGLKLNPLLFGAVGVVVLIGLLAGMLAWKPWSAKPNGPNGEKGTVAFEDLLKKYLAANPDDQAAILAQMYDDGSLSSDPATRQKEQARREELRKEFLRTWIDRFQKAELLSQELPQRFVSGKKVAMLHSELKLIQEKPPADQAVDAEEKQCLRFSEMRARELGSAP